MWRKSVRPIHAHCDGKWAVIPAAGTKQIGMQRGYCDDLTLGEQGAPERFTRQTPIHTPAEIGK